MLMILSGFTHQLYHLVSQKNFTIHGQDLLRSSNVYQTLPIGLLTPEQEIIDKWSTLTALNYAYLIPIYHQFSTLHSHLHFHHPQLLLLYHLELNYSWLMRTTLQWHQDAILTEFTDPQFVTQILTHKSGTDFFRRGNNVRKWY